MKKSYFWGNIKDHSDKFEQVSNLATFTNILFLHAASKFAASHVCLS